MKKTTFFQRTTRALPAILFMSLLTCSPALAVTDENLSMDEIFSMSLEELMEIEIVTASRLAEPLAGTIATTYVITGKQIRAMGARTIYDALAQVPGLTLSGNKGGTTKLFSRGIGSEFSSQFLLLLDNHILNDPLSGGALSGKFDRLSLDNIKRIEVVQGPGSSLYGGNAFLAMINIITLKGADIGGTEASVHTEFDSGGHAVNYYNLLYGDTFESGWQASINIHGRHGDGVERQIDQDSLGRSGEADSREENYDIDLQLANESFAMHGRYFTSDGGTYYGMNNILNDDSSSETQHGFVDATYQLVSGPDIGLELRGTIDQWAYDEYYLFLPDDTPGGPLTFKAQIDIMAYMGELRTTYTGFSNHRFISGLSYRHEEIKDPHYWINEVSIATNWIDPARRDIWAVYLNDNYQISEALQATMSGRYDHYSDFGGSFNPRLGLSWQINSTYKLKVLYGTAFRAPDFVSQYSRNNPVLSGNPDLNPEEITTWELSLSAKPSELLLLQATLFRNEVDDLVGPGSTLPKIYDNIESVTSKGVELSLRYDITSRLHLSGNYTYVDLDYSTNYPQPTVPQNSGSVNLDYQINDYLHLNLNGFGQDKAERATGDTRSDISGYVIFNTTLTAALTNHIDLQFSIFNLADKEYAYAAPANTIPDDYTAPCRSFMLGLIYDF